MLKEKQKFELFVLFITLPYCRLVLTGSRSRSYSGYAVEQFSDDEYECDYDNHRVNFSYFEAGEQKQALVKLVAFERCAEKLLYKNCMEKNQEKQDNVQHHRKRRRLESDDDSDAEYHRSKNQRKGKKASTSLSKKKFMMAITLMNNLVGMFP